MGFRELSDQDRHEALAVAARAQAKLTLILREQNHWRMLHSRLFAVEGDWIWAQPPTRPDPSQPVELPAEAKVGVSFRIEPRKYSFVAQPGGTADYKGQPAVALSAPHTMHTTERRMYRHVPVPVGSARASFWPGGREAEPEGITPERPLWSGRLVDLSINGFQIQTSSDAAEYLESGDLVGVRMLFGKDTEPIYVDAQFRHVIAGRETANLGFQLAGLEQSIEGMDALEALAGKLEQLGLS